MHQTNYSGLRQRAEAGMARLTEGAITAPAFDALTKALLVPPQADDPERLYGREAIVFIRALEPHRFQIAAWQINVFAPGVFGADVARKCTPVLLTVRVHGAHPYLNHSLRTAAISVEGFYLGTHYSGSKGPQCDRVRFGRLAERLYEGAGITAFDKRLAYELMNTNLICHHLAEAMSYAFGALEVFWQQDQALFLMSSGAWLDPREQRLFIECVDGFSPHPMTSRFEVPHYRIPGDEPRGSFHEDHEMLRWEVEFRGEQEVFYLPSGYQKVANRRQGEHANVVTTQHIVEHLLRDYFQRENAFVVANTFQTLEYLSRAVLMIQQGRREEGVDFLKRASSCLGHYPANDVEAQLTGKERQYPSYASEYFRRTFFRAPVLS